MAITEESVARPGQLPPVGLLGSLLLRTAGGDEAAFTIFVKATSPRARGLAHRIAGPEASADVVADAFFQIWRDAAKFDPSKGTALAWLLTVVASRALDTLRRRKARPTQACESLIEEQPCPQAGPEWSASYLQQRGRLRHALGSLDPIERQLLALAYFEDRSHGQIAEHMSLPLGTIKARIRRCYGKLRLAMTD